MQPRQGLTPTFARHTTATRGGVGLGGSASALVSAGRAGRGGGVGSDRRRPWAQRRRRRPWARRRRSCAWRHGLVPGEGGSVGVAAVGSGRLSSQPEARQRSTHTGQSKHGATSRPGMLRRQAGSQAAARRPWGRRQVAPGAVAASAQRRRPLAAVAASMGSAAAAAAVGSAAMVVCLATRSCARERRQRRGRSRGIWPFVESAVAAEARQRSSAAAHAQGRASTGTGQHKAGHTLGGRRGRHKAGATPRRAPGGIRGRRQALAV